MLTRTVLIYHTYRDKQVYKNGRKLPTQFYFISMAEFSIEFSNRDNVSNLTFALLPRCINEVFKVKYNKCMDVI